MKEKKNIGGIIAWIIIFILIICYVVYSKSIKKEQPKIVNPQINNKIDEQPKSEDNKQEEKEKETEKVKEPEEDNDSVSLYDGVIYFRYNDDNNKVHLIRKKSNKYSEVFVSNKSEFVFLGMNESKIYYASKNKIYYASLNDKQETKWLSICDSCDVNIVKGYMVGETIYFSTDSYDAGGSKYDGILSININDTSYSNHKKIVDSVEEWYLGSNNKEIYYQNYSGSNYEISKLDIDTNDKKVIIKSCYPGFDYNGKNLIYYKWNNVKGSDKYELHLYDTINAGDFFIATVNGSKCGSISCVASLDDEDVFYTIRKKGTIYKYNIETEEKTLLYTVKNTSEFYGINYLGDNYINIMMETFDDKFIHNDKIVKEEKMKIDVTTLSGKTRKVLRNIIY